MSLNRKMRRQMAKNIFTERTVKITPEDRMEIANKAVKVAFEETVPIFCLYLIERFHCKENGVQSFMKWFNDVLAWKDGNPKAMKEIKEEVLKKSGCEIIYE